MNRATRRAATKARQLIGSREPINFEAVQAQEDALNEMDEPTLCPCCSFMWDRTEERAVHPLGRAAIAAWRYRTLSLPVNEVGDDLGQRARKMIELADLEGDTG